MKKFLFFLLLILSSNCYGANYYFDLASGNDTTGDGSYGNPWKTIDKCTTSRTAGDECRCAKSTITTLSGTLTFTNGSTSVTTSVDQSAVVAAGDLIGKNSGLEGWWKVSSVAAGAITLSYQYWGLSGSGSAVTGYKITPVTASEEYDVNTSGTSASAYMKISGGWTLGTQTQDGITAFTSSYTYNIDFNSKNYVELSKFIVLSQDSKYCLNVNGRYNYIHDCSFINTTYGVFYTLISNNILENLVSTGGVDQHFALSGSNIKLTNCYSFSCGSGTNDDAFYVGSYNNNVLIGCRAYNAYYAGIVLSNSGNTFLIDFISDTVRGGNNVYIPYSSNGVVFYNATLLNASGRCVFTGYGTTKLIESTLTAGSSGLFYLSTNYRTSLDPLYVYKPIGSDSILYFPDGTITIDSSAEARSGNCLKFTPSDANTPLVYKVGNVKIPSSGSDLTLSVYAKKDVSYDGTTWLMSSRNGKWLSNTAKSLSTSYAKISEVVSSSDLVANEYLDLYVVVTGTAGNVYVDDFSSEQ